MDLFFGPVWKVGGISQFLMLSSQLLLLERIWKLRNSSTVVFVFDFLEGTTELIWDCDLRWLTRMSFSKQIEQIPSLVPQWGAVDAEIKVPSGQNTELKGSPFKAWSRSVYSLLAALASRDFLLISTLPVHSLHFFQNLSQFFCLCWLWLTPVPVWPAD